MSGAEIIVILLAVLLLFGADKVPEIARTVGKGLSEVRKVTSDLKKDFEKTDVGKEVKGLNEEIKEVKKTLDFTNPNPSNNRKNDLDNSIK